jgi:hypothetical protein
MPRGPGILVVLLAFPALAEQPRSIHIESDGCPDAQSTAIELQALLPTDMGSSPRSPTGGAAMWMLWWLLTTAACRRAIASGFACSARLVICAK